LLFDPIGHALELVLISHCFLYSSWSPAAIPLSNSAVL
jgi:hypothetical protein